MCVTEHSNFEKECDILFVIPNIYGAYWSPSANSPHLGVAYLAAVLLANGIEINIVDMRLGYDFDALLKIVKRSDPMLIGITAYSHEFTKVRELIDRIKRSEDRKVVVGGPHVSAVRSQVLKMTKTDFAVKGEGEFTLLELCDSTKRHHADYSRIKGLIWNDGERIVENEDRPFIQDLDSLPFPAFEEFELSRYLGYETRGRLPVTTSRGCPYQCIFCSVRLSMGNKFRPRSPKNVVDELEHWYDKGWNEFGFVDDNFTFDMERAGLICDLLLQRGIKINWYLDNGIRVNRINKDLLHKMKRAGCKYIAYGIESGNDRILKRIKKGIKVEQAKRATEITRDVGIIQGATFIIGHPGESFKDFMDTMRLAGSIPVDRINFYNLVPYPGTELFQWIKKNAIFLVDEEEYLDEFSYWHEDPIFETEDFSAEERKRAFKIGYSLHKKKDRLYMKKMYQSRFGKYKGFLVWQMTKSRRVEKTLMRVVSWKKIRKTILDLMKL